MGRDDDEDAGATTAWSGNPETQQRRRLSWTLGIAIGLATLVIATAITIVVTRNGKGDVSTREASNEPSVAAAPLNEPLAPSITEWWTPPQGERESIEALAYAFAGVDENDLGSMFDEKLRPIHGVLTANVLRRDLTADASRPLAA